MNQKLPEPMTSTDFPMETFDLWHAWTATARGSIKAASSKLTLSGSL